MGVQASLAAWINTQEGYDLSKEAIESLKKAGLGLVITDNNSSLGGGYLRDKADIYIRNQKNLGYSPAMNQAIKLTTTPYVALAETDIRVSDNVVEVGVDILDKNPKVGMVHYRMIPYNEPLSFGDDTWFGYMERWCTIAFMLWRKEALELFDEGFKVANYEDYDILYRARQKGWISAYTNKAGYQHHDSYFQKLLNQDDRAKVANSNREYFKSKHGEYPDDLFDILYPLDRPYLPFP